jgi:hypothetical protein
MTDRYLMTLWRHAVLAEHNCRCFMCGMPYIDILECHHIVRRANRVLRWDWRNGVPLCSTHHKWAHTNQGRRGIEEMLGKAHMDYLDKYERVTIKDYLIDNGLSRAEFEKQLSEELKSKVEK